MSSTRKAKDDSELHQSRYASSTEFERGLVANMVAKRCALLNSPADRELIWFVQYLSHQPGGLAAVVTTLLASFCDRLGTPSMVKNRRGVYQPEDVKKIRQEIPALLRRRFPLRGESADDLKRVCGHKVHKLPYELRKIMAERDGRTLYDGPDSDAALEQKEAARHPASYPASALLDLSREAATNGFDDANDTDSLERELSNLCLDPGWKLADDAPWYFADLVNVLREYHQQWVKEKSSVVVTTLGQKVSDNLDYTLYSGGLTLMEGNARLGKSFAAKSWCEQHPGQARFIEVPDGNDDARFFRELSRGLGLGSFLNYKVCEIRARVESVLLTRDLVLVLDEAQRLWPQRNLRYGCPGRIIWLMRMINAKVAVCLISTPQFSTSQKAIEKNGWNSAQFVGRIGHYEFLPVKLDDADLMAVAREALPNISDKLLKGLALYARASSRYLAAVDAIAKRAGYVAFKAGRKSCTDADVQTAMADSVIPSDTLLMQTLKQAEKAATASKRNAAAASNQVECALLSRSNKPAEPLTAIPRANSMVLAET